MRTRLVPRARNLGESQRPGTKVFACGVAVGQQAGTLVSSPGAQKLLALGLARGPASCLPLPDDLESSLPPLAGPRARLFFITCTQGTPRVGSAPSLTFSSSYLSCATPPTPNKFKSCSWTSEWRR